MTSSAHGERNRSPQEQEVHDRIIEILQESANTTKEYGNRVCDKNLPGDLHA